MEEIIIKDLGTLTEEINSNLKVAQGKLLMGIRHLYPKGRENYQVVCGLSILYY